VLYSVAKLFYAEGRGDGSVLTQLVDENVPAVPSNDCSCRIVGLDMSSIFGELIWLLLFD
jgi:hypothetical protein